MSTSVYVHFPWCLQKCPYCDFASATIRRPEVPHTLYADAVLRELELRAAEGISGQLESVFFGGGTPSLWEPRELGRVLSAIRGAFGAGTRDVEVTVECNPSSLDAERAAGLREAGVDRLSVGVQSLDDQRLRFLGRLHDGPGALTALRAAQAHVPRVSGDLMFGMPEQTPDDFLAEVSQLLELGLSHLSVYALTVEPETRFGELHRKGKLQLAKEDAYADTFLACEALLTAAGFEHYEVSNYARPGQTSRHNQHYWRGGDYLGLGCAAVGCVNQRRYRNQTRPQAYLDARARPALEQESEDLDGQAIVREALMLGLRTSEGVALGELEARAGVNPRHGRERALQRGIDNGQLRLEDDRLRVPHERWLQLDGIVSDLF
ncbi:MAG TPA: radical SAM family heme chaperone HemW [Polyangiales bacterium]|nr:radical SAM family heme chaperone HemW [Polyangiales bacterium]